MSVLRLATMITDIDECALELDQCEQICVNLNGSYTCECSDGYQTVTGRYYACEGVLYYLLIRSFEWLLFHSISFRYR